MIGVLYCGRKNINAAASYGFTQEQGITTYMPHICQVSYLRMRLTCLYWVFSHSKNMKSILNILILRRKLGGSQRYECSIAMAIRICACLVTP